MLKLANAIFLFGCLRFVSKIILKPVRLVCRTI